MQPRWSIRTQRYRWTLAVLVVGVAVRIALLPITFGQDFTVWDKASTATLRGVDVYAHHPHYLHGPYAYFPLFLYLELPFRAAANQDWGSFVVLGKVPILLADIACLLLLAAVLRRRGVEERWIALGTAAFFLNPLVVYDSAWYGRFDTLGCALLLVVTYRLDREDRGTGQTAVWFGLAVAAKTFPVFALLGIVRAVRGRRWLVPVLLPAVLAAVSAPYLGSWRAMLHDLVVYDGRLRRPSGLTWQYELSRVVGIATTKHVGYVVLGLFAVALIALCRRLGPTRYIAAALVLFLLTAKFVLEQYLIWPMPWLVLLALTDPQRLLRRASAALVVVFTATGMFDNESYHPLGRSPLLLITVVDLACLAYLVLLVRQRQEPSATAANAARTA